MLARAYRFESWTKLKAFVNGATVARLIAAVRAGEVAQALLGGECGEPEIIRMALERIAPCERKRRGVPALTPERGGYGK